MRVIKDLTQGVIVKHINLNNKDYLAVTCMLYYDLLSLKILNDAKLWEEPISFLRANTLLDEGYPKAFGEFLAYGHCFNQEPKNANQVSIKVGNIEKKLDVFGDRFYNVKVGGGVEISEPLEFKKMKISFENAYGGEGFEQNPIGKGFVKDKKLQTSNLRLHNIDSTKHKSAGLMDDERIVPQSFEAIDMNIPSRLKLGGTYDEKWSKTRWPYFPLDIQREFFQRALSDQWNKEYYHGDEEILIKNMNKTYPILETSLPNKNIKIFITKVQKEDYYKEKIIEESFFEIKSHIDTVMLFPDIAKGIVTFRAMVECIDDEYSDIKEVFFHTEELHEHPKEISFYEEIKNRTTNLEFDVKKHENEMKKKLAPIWDIPRNLEHNLIDMPSGLVPQVSPTPSLIAKDSIKKWNNMQQTYKDISENGLSLSLIKNAISPEHYKFIKEQGGEISEKVEQELKHSFKEGLKKIDEEEYQHKIESILSEHQKKTKSFFSKFKESSPSFFKNIFSNKNMSNKQKKDLKDVQEKYENESLDAIMINSWEDGAKFFVGDSVLLLKRLQRFKDELYKIGLRDVSLEISHIGYNPKKNAVDKYYWKQKEPIALHRGFVVPIFQNEHLKKVIIRPKISFMSDNVLYLHDDKDDLIIEGSKECDMLIEGKYTKTLIITDDIIKAWIINQDIWDISSVIVFKDEEMFLKSEYFKENQSNIDTVVTTTFKLSSSKINHFHYEIDNKNFLQSYSSKDFRNKILSFIKDEKLYEEKTKIEKQKEKQGIFFVPQISHINYLDKMKNIFIDKIKNKHAHLKSVFKDNIAFDKSFSKIDLDDIFLKMDKELDSVLNSSLNNTSTFEVKKMDKIYDSIISQIQTMKKTSQKKEKHYFDDALEKLTSQYENIKGEMNDVTNMSRDTLIPDWMKDAFKSNFDMDLDAPELVFNEKEKLLEHYKEKKSFKNATIYNLTLDELDLSGADFSFAKFDNCTLKNSDLQNTNFSKSILNGTDCTGSNFRNSTIINAKLLSTILDNAICDDVDFSQTLFQGIDSKNLSIKNSKFNNTTFINTTFENSNFECADFNQILFNNIEFINSNLFKIKFKESLLSKCSFTKTNMEKSYIFRTALAQCNFLSTSLKESSFHTTSFIQKNDFKFCDIKNIEVEKSSFLEASIKECDFSESYFLDVFLNKSFLENVKFIMCDFENTQLTRNHIKHSELFLSIFIGCSFRKTYFEYVDMTKSSLFQADFWNIKVKQLDLRESNIKKTILEKDDSIYSLEEILY